MIETWSIPSKWYTDGPCLHGIEGQRRRRNEGLVSDPDPGVVLLVSSKTMSSLQCSLVIAWVDERVFRYGTPQGSRLLKKIPDGCIRSMTPMRITYDVEVKEQTLRGFHCEESVPPTSMYWKKFRGCSQGPGTFILKNSQVLRKEPSKLKGPVTPAPRLSFICPEVFPTRRS